MQRTILLFMLVLRSARERLSRPREHGVAEFPPPIASGGPTRMPHFRSTLPRDASEDRNQVKPALASWALEGEGCVSFCSAIFSKLKTRFVPLHPSRERFSGISTTGRSIYCPARFEPSKNLSSEFHFVGLSEVLICFTPIIVKMSAPMVQIRLYSAVFVPYFSCSRSKNLTV